MLKIINDSMLNLLNHIKPNTIDSIVTDPPYELNFMNKGWDNTGIAFQKETWQKCYEVLKPGGYLLAFGGSRTFHRIACAIEDAGFEIRDCIMWLYGSGFPKSMDISKQIDKNANSDRLNIIGKWLKQKREECNLTRDDVAKILQLTSSAIYNWEENPKKYGFPTKDNWNKIKKIYNFDGTWDDFTKEAKREVIGTKKVMEKETDVIYGKYKGGEVDITTPTTNLAKQWQGWGTCLKPAYEPIIVARKPFKGSLVDNVIEYGVGGLNIDECRVGETGGVKKIDIEPNSGSKNSGFGCNGKLEELNKGRFPANLILTYDENDCEEVCGGFPSEKGNSASRYFYCAKASKKDRDEGLDEFEEIGGGSYQFRQDGSLDGKTPSRKNIHPTVKPTELMQYLVRLVTPKGGTVLDPFMGSGSTGKAVAYENKERKANYNFIGIELSAEYCEIARARIEYVEKQKKTEKLSIFDFIGE